MTDVSSDAEDKIRGLVASLLNVLTSTACPPEWRFVALANAAGILLSEVKEEYRDIIPDEVAETMRIAAKRAAENRNLQ